MNPTPAPNSSKTPTPIDSGWVPFEYVNEGVPLVAFRAEANGGNEIWLTLDTGNASGLHFSEATATRLGLDFSKPIPNEGDQLSVGSDFVPSAFESRIQSLAIGAWRSQNQEAMISNYVDYLASQLGSRCEGNLGFELLGQLCVTIDYPGKRIRFENEAIGHSPSVSFELGESPWIILEAQVNGTASRKFILDTGAGGTLIDPDFAAQLGLTLGDNIDMMGATGMDVARAAPIDSLVIGTKEMLTINSVVADIIKPLSAAAGVELSGIIGHDFFGDSVLAIDYRRKQIRFQ